MSRRKKLESKQRFTIKKFKIGAASVLIGTVFAVFAGNVQADESVSSSDSVTTYSTVDNTNLSNIVEPVEEEKSTNLSIIEENSVEKSSLEEVPNNLVLENEIKEVAEEEIVFSKQLEQNNPENNNDLEIEETFTNTEIGEENSELETVEEKITENVTKSQSVQKNDVPTTSAMERPSNEGDKIPSGIQFRNGNNAASQTDQLTAQDIQEQVTWVDFGDTNSLKNYKTLPSGDIALQVGTVYEKEIVPGYTFVAEVIGLKPFMSTDVYKERSIGDPTGGYDPTLTNKYRQAIQGTPYQPGNGFNNGEPGTTAEIVVRKQDQNWSHLLKAGVNAGDKKVVLTTEKTSADVGIQWKVFARYQGNEYPVDIIVADAEESKGYEAIIFTTNGSDWEKIADVSNTAGNHYSPSTASDLSSDNRGLFPDLYKAQYWQNGDITDGGIGTKVFGPVATSIGQHSVPILKTKATEVGIYINSSGAQGVQFGFIFSDISDAPDSYGTAEHIFTADTPYLGTVRPDYDHDRTPVPANEAWIRDDNADAPDEGVSQLSADGNSFVIHEADNQQYTLSIKANRSGHAKAFVKGWVDFNNNGKFDTNEASAMTEITADGALDLVFQNSPQIIDTNIAALGARVRIALKEEDIETPTKLASSGEVEDFLIQIIHPPRGERKETTGLQGKNQTTQINFTAYGKLKTDLNSLNTIDSTVAVKIVKSDGTLVSTYTETGEGTYTVASNGTVTFTPIPSFHGTAKGIVLRATDKNGVTTGWTSNTALNGLDNINDNINGFVTMDAVYIPTVTAVTPTGTDAVSTGPQGQVQTGKPTFTGGDVAVPMDDTVAATFDDGTTS
ncbi:CshA/CshB family fibrillar adhesin-related protein, partial [Streptococcus zalophi]